MSLLQTFGRLFGHTGLGENDLDPFLDPFMPHSVRFGLTLLVKSHFAFGLIVLVKCGTGGGSLLRRSADGGVTLGPDSVGHRLITEALCFCGGTTTATDVAVVME